MKKILMLLSLAVGFTATAFAGDTYSHDASVLPQVAQTTISNNFKSDVSVVKTEKTIGRVVEYEVTLTDGTEISFDRNGDWKNVETSRASSVPENFVPAEVKSYIAKNHPGTKVLGIEKENSGYEVELSNGVDMKFNKSGVFMRYDN